MISLIKNRILCWLNTKDITIIKKENISSEWKTSFDQQVKQSREKDKLNSLVQLRNDFAHGDSISVSIDTVINYFDSGVKILNILDSVCT